MSFLGNRLMRPASRIPWRIYSTHCMERLSIVAQISICFEQNLIGKGQSDDWFWKLLSVSRYICVLVSIGNVWQRKLTEEFTIKKKTSELKETRAITSQRKVKINILINFVILYVPSFTKKFHTLKSSSIPVERTVILYMK